MPIALTFVPALAQGCQVSGGQSTAEFFNTGRGGLPPTPYESLSSTDILDDVRIPEQNADTSTNFINQNLPASAIVEANGWVRGENGKIMLTAAVPDVPPKLCHLR